jgi:hypothetical protein
MEFIFHFYLFFVSGRGSGHNIVQSVYQITVIQLTNHCTLATKSVYSGYQIMIWYLEYSDLVDGAQGFGNWINSRIGHYYSRTAAAYKE